MNEAAKILTNIICPPQIKKLKHLYKGKKVICLPQHEIIPHILNGIPMAIRCINKYNATDDTEKLKYVTASIMISLGYARMIEIGTRTPFVTQLSRALGNARIPRDTKKYLLRVYAATKYSLIQPTAFDYYVAYFSVPASDEISEILIDQSCSGKNPVTIVADLA